MPITNTHLKETIINSAKELFSDQGFAGTSIKQIAKASGCTTAALYYYFEGGKAHILREVIQLHSVEVLQSIDKGAEYDSLQDFLQDFARAISQSMPERLNKMAWLVLDFNKLPQPEQDYLRNTFVQLHAQVHHHIQKFIPDDEGATLAWVVVCGYMGYGQLFYRLGLQSQINVSPGRFADTLAKAVAGEQV